MGAIGAGVAFRYIHLPNLDRHRDDVDLVGVTARSETSRRAAKDIIKETIGRETPIFDTVDELLASKPDAVLLTVPIQFTHEIASRVIDSGIALICEKPLGESADQAADIVARAERSGVLLAVAENFRYQSGYARARELIHAGTIGEPKLCASTFLHFMHRDEIYPYSADRWARNIQHRGGYLLDAGPHFVAGLRAAVGETPSTAYTVAASLHPEHLGGPWDTTFTSFTFRSGLRGQLTLGLGSPDRGGKDTKIFGTNGTLVLKRGQIEIWRCDSSADEVHTLEDANDGSAGEWDDFVAALTGRAELRYSPWEAVEDLAVLDAMLASAGSGNVESVKTFGARARPRAMCSGQVRNESG